MELYQSEFASCPPWDTTRRAVLLKKVRDAQEKYIQQNKLEQAQLKKAQEEEESLYLCKKNIIHLCLPDLHSSRESDKDRYPPGVEVDHGEVVEKE
ncbi:hypothetical protein KI387_032790, partial [Taxus chinensis]